jgi:arabinan endo-1,5-alpha-L-arabinosidase
LTASMTIRYLLIILLVLFMLEPSEAAQTFAAPVHDPAIIRQGAFYYLFSTGRGIPIRRSSDLVHWQRTGRVFGEDIPQWAAEAVPGAGGFWAPDISFSGGVYRVYYSISTYGSQRSVIGLVVNKTLDANSPDYKWTDCGMVVESAQGKTDFNAIDADAFVDEHGDMWLVFGSFWGGIRLARMDVSSGKVSDPNFIPIAARPDAGGAVEGACVMRHDGYYYLFASFDLCCKGVDSTYKIMVGRSKMVTGPYLDRQERNMCEGGGSLVLDSGERWRGPGHNEVLHDGDKDYLVHHAYDAQNNGRPTLLIRPITWDKDGWPVPGNPLEP